MNLIKKIALLSTLILYLQVFSQDLNLKFYAEKVKNSYKIYADNNELTPISTYLDLELSNMTTALQSGKIEVIPANSKRVLITTVTQKIAGKSFAYNYTVHYNFGDVTQQKYDEDFIYSLPFEIGKSQMIYQGYNGNFSHRGEKTLDFDMKVGSEIFAARGGKVVKVVSQNDTGCPKISCAEYNNLIRIMHSDNSFGEYLHLEKNGAAVAVGDVVTKGQYIGKSGNTGFTIGPHLHFSVYLNRMEGSRFYIPTKFKTENKNPEILNENNTYKREE